MTKELTHRATELKDLGWSNEDVIRYAELWDYRQRWGAINLEREDRQFLRKAEAALPKIQSPKASTKKPTQEKSYYRWLRFFLDSMDEAEKKLDLKKGDRGIWPILLEEELRAIDYYEPVLGLPDTIKAKGLCSAREDLVQRVSSIIKGDVKIKNFDFEAPLKELKDQTPSNWRDLRDGHPEGDKSYPVVSGNCVEEFRLEVRSVLLPLMRELLPSLFDTDKPNPPDDWSRE